MVFWSDDATAIAGTVHEELRDGGRKTRIESHPCRGCKGGGAPRKAGDPGRWDPTGASGRSSQVGKDGYFGAGGRSFELETILVNEELAGFAIVQFLGLSPYRGNLVLGAFRHGDSKFSELGLQLFEAEKRTSRSADIVGRGSQGLSRDDFRSRIASVDG